MVPETEEVCNWWASLEGNNEFAEKELVKNNFVKSFTALMTKYHGAKLDSDFNFNDFDFSAIKDHLLREAEIRKARSTEEKNVEKEEKLRKENYYNYCLFDNQVEKVANTLVEPPGIFRGRGEHPSAGLLKHRIVPEFCSINIGQDDPIPRCDVPGHAWKRVMENKDATWLANFRDERSSFAPSKYVFLAAESKLKGENDKKKYEKARTLKSCIIRVRESYRRAMESNDSVANQLGVCTYLIDKLALRVGNEKGEDEADTVGCCSLRVEHIKFPSENEIELNFLGKDSMQYLNTVEVDPLVQKHLRKFCEAKQPNMDIFEKINAGRLNDFMKESMENLSAKVFRTYNASHTLQTELNKGNINNEKDSVD